MSSDTSETAGDSHILSVVILIYDGDCGSCTKLAGFARERLPDAVDVQPWQRLDLSKFGLMESDVRSRSYFIDESGDTFGGAQSLIRGAHYMGGAWPVFSRVFRLPVLSQLSELVYKVVARNRYRLPGGSPDCELPRS